MSRCLGMIANVSRTLITSGASGNVEFLVNGRSVGVTQIVSGAAFDNSSFQTTGDFEFLFDSNDIDDLWIVVDWARKIWHSGEESEGAGRAFQAESGHILLKVASGQIESAPENFSTQSLPYCENIEPGTGG